MDKTTEMAKDAGIYVAGHVAGGLRLTSRRDRVVDQAASARLHDPWRRIAPRPIPDRGTDHAGRRAKRFLMTLQKYEIFARHYQEQDR